MRLIICISILFFFSFRCHAQEMLFSVNMKNVTVGEVFDRVSRKIGMDFFYNNEKIDAYKRVDVKMKNGGLPELFQYLFPGFVTKYEVVNDCILIVEMSPRQKHIVSVIKGMVVDEHGYLLSDVNIRLGGAAEGSGTVSDAGGRFTLEVADARDKQLEFSYIGFEKKIHLLKGHNENLTIVLKQEITELNACVVTGYGEQTKISVVGAVSDVHIDDMDMPDGSVSNFLGGRVAGIIALTRSGEPGNDFSEFWIRGISTFGANQKALVLIDGVEGDMNELEPEEIDRFTVLKDASSTALYGVRGANGVILIQTKRGKAGPTKVSVSSSVTWSHSPFMPRYLNGTDYTLLANEASRVRGGRELYSPVELELITQKLDPDFYPDVDWQKEVLKSHTWNRQHGMSVSGGGRGVRFFLNCGLTNKSALYNTRPFNDYDPNVNWKRYAIRANLDFSLAPGSSLSLSVNTVFTKQKKPGYQHREAIWESISNMNPIAVPLRYSDGSLPGLGVNEYETSPFVLLNYTGFSEEKSNNYRVDLGFEQQIHLGENEFVFHAFASLKSNTTNYHYRLKHPETFKAEERDADGMLKKKLLHKAQNFNYSAAEQDNRFYYASVDLKYNRTFNACHQVNALVHYYMQENQRSYENLEYKPEDLLPERYQAIAGRLMYSLHNTYFAEFNFGYTGSENLPPKEQFNFFPSFGMGWILTGDHSLLIPNRWLHFLKLRASFGRVGNDRILDQRFPYLDRLAFENVPSNWGQNGITETFIGAKNSKWEVAEKLNLGVDFQLCDGMVKGSVDLFRNWMKGIFQKRISMPLEVGTPSYPYVNVGQMYSQGVDAEIKFYKLLASRFSFAATGSLTFTENHVVHWEEMSNSLNYQEQSNYPYRVNRGLISLGLFCDSLDILSSPKQNFGEVRPGDIKYKDINGDGRIDLKDRMPLKNSDIPQMMYGISGELKYKNWVLGLFFVGAAKVSTFNGGEGVYPFAKREKGNVLSKVKNERWTPAWYSGSSATENPNARFPRLTYGESANNNLSSTFWLNNASYFRLKMIELGYCFENITIRGVRINDIKINFFGENLFLWSKQKKWGWDPEQLSSNGSVYPIQRKFSLRVEITL